MDFNADTATEAVQRSFDNTADPRLRELLQGLTRHLHDFVRETRPSVEEWEQAIGFLTEVGQTCDDTRQEFILLSDVLGVSMLVETLNEDEGGTEGTVLGPFHVVASPERELGESVDLVHDEQDCLVRGRVLDTSGAPVPGAEVDVWQCTEEGFYDVQQPDVQPLGNGRGLFRTDPAGNFWFRTVVPSHYPIPHDGPVGRLLSATGRHPYRPAHIHFIVDAAGHRGVTTHSFVSSSPYTDSDAVFAVKSSLLTDFAETDDPGAAARHGLRNPFRLAEFDVVLDKDG